MSTLQDRLLVELHDYHLVLVDRQIHHVTLDIVNGRTIADRDFMVIVQQAQVVGKFAALYTLQGGENLLAIFLGVDNGDNVVIVVHRGMKVFRKIYCPLPKSHDIIYELVAKINSSPFICPVISLFLRSTQ